jgi:hypothetical protein
MATTTTTYPIPVRIDGIWHYHNVEVFMAFIKLKDRINDLESEMKIVMLEQKNDNVRLQNQTIENRLEKEIFQLKNSVAGITTQSVNKMTKCIRQINVINVINATIHHQTYDGAQ